MFKISRFVRGRGRRRSRRPTPWPAAIKKHYAEHKEAARDLCHERLAHYNQHYGLQFNRVAIRNTRSRWGSCSSKKNLNFNYRILFLEPALQDYLIVHELCHLQEMNHAPQFWALVAQQVPDYKQKIKQLRAAEKEFSVKKMKYYPNIQVLESTMTNSQSVWSF